MEIYDTLRSLEDSGNLRSLPSLAHQGKYIVSDGVRMLNLSSNDYLGLASDTEFYREFTRSVLLPRISYREIPEECLFSSSSSRLLTGNFSVYGAVEEELSCLYGAEAALVFGSGYHMNSGILPAVTDKNDLILADKLVHASIIDGMRLSSARQIRWRHQDYGQLKHLLDKYHGEFRNIIIVTESIFSMDGDVTDIAGLVSIKTGYDNVQLYVDEAHGVGARGRLGLGVAEEQGCIGQIDFLCGTFGKALASAGGYVVCSSAIRNLLVNRMRPFIFTTALPPVNMLWTLFVLKSLPGFGTCRDRLLKISARVREVLAECGYTSSSSSHIIPVIVGDSHESVRLASEFRRRGFFLMPVRPPTVPDGTARLRLSLTAAMTDEDTEELLQAVKSLL